MSQGFRCLECRRIKSIEKAAIDFPENHFCERCFDAIDERESVLEARQWRKGRLLSSNAIALWAAWERDEHGVIFTKGIFS